jgi:DNA-binding beta-propeller fold protein YncE
MLVTDTVAVCGQQTAVAKPVLAAQPGTAVGDDTPTGKTITPLAAKGVIFQELKPNNPLSPNQAADRAMAVSVSPDGKVLAILTSGYNLYNGAIAREGARSYPEHVFLFDVTGSQPKQLQVLPLPNSFQGLAWAPKGDRLFASGGDDDTVVEFIRAGWKFAAGRTFPLGHQAGLGLDTGPMSAGLAVSPDGARLLAANLQNDSVSLIDLASGRVVAEQDLRPGIIDAKRRGQAGGSFPRSVAWSSTGHAYVASERDREIISLTVSGRGRLRVVRRIPVRGQPIALTSNRAGSRVYAALDTTNQVVVIDTARDRVIESFDVTAPENLFANTRILGGANSNALALSPDERTLLVSNGGENAVAVVRLSDPARGVAASRRGSTDSDDDDYKLSVDRSVVLGLVPTGWYPTGVATSKDGGAWYIVNAKSPMGPNARWCQEVDPVRKLCVLKDGAVSDFSFAENGARLLLAENQFNFQLEKAGFLTMPAPATLELARLTKQVARNNRLDQPDQTAADDRLFGFLREHIKHVIYIIKENRSYDQVLGDLEIGNGDPRLALFGTSIAPNHHAIARNFVTLDNFLVSGEASLTGWDWSVSAQTNDFLEHTEPWAVRGASMGSFWGTSRNINMGYATSAERHAESSVSPSDPDILPGVRDVAASDGPGGDAGKGHIWDAALRHGLTVRNYGFYGVVDWSPPTDRHPVLEREPFAKKTKMFLPTIAALIPFTDVYYRGWDPAYPDYWRYREWKREFDAYSESGVLSNLMLVELGNDHLGYFDRAIDGVNTPETQMADNDYALGLLIEAVANSPFAKDTLIVSVEDDALDGPDHVDATRSVALFAGPYVRQRALVSTRFTTVSVVKTMEEILGIGPIGLNDALAAPMSDVFDRNAADWSYKATVPDVLRSTKLPLPPSDRASIALPKHSPAYWTKAMIGQDFSGPDRVDAATFNRSLWRGLKGDEPYPRITGADLRTDRKGLQSSTQQSRENNHAAVSDSSSVNSR